MKHLTTIKALKSETFDNVVFVIIFDVPAGCWSLPKMDKKFGKFRESNKLLKHELDSI